MSITQVVGTRILATLLPLGGMGGRPEIPGLCHSPGISPGHPQPPPGGSFLPHFRDKILRGILWVTPNDQGHPHPMSHHHNSISTKVADFVSWRVDQATTPLLLATFGAKLRISSAGQEPAGFVQERGGLTNMITAHVLNFCDSSSPSLRIPPGGGLRGRTHGPLFLPPKH